MTMPTSSADETESQGTAPSETSAESNQPVNLADALMELPLSDLSHIAAAASAILAGKLKSIFSDDAE
jgi:hypothetical protein